MAISMGQTILQNAYVVNDLHQAIEHWATTLGLGPFFVIENAPLETLHRGQPVTLELSVAMVQAGPINIELIQQLNDQPSTYRDVYRVGEEGFHHVCMLVGNFDEEVDRYKAMGYELSLEAHMGLSRIVYVDTHETLGCQLELVEDSPAIQGLYQRVREGAETWDGTDLVRPLFPESAT